MYPGEGNAAGDVLSWSGSTYIWQNPSLLIGLVSNTQPGLADTITGARRVFAANATGTGAIWSSSLLTDVATTGSPDAAAVVQPANTSGTPTALRVTGGAHTTLAAGTEDTDVNLNLARTVQFSTGAIVAQRAVRITTPTYAFVGASTISDAATVAISGAPVAGANATLTRSAALWIESGALQFGAAAARSGDQRIPHNWSIIGRDSGDANDRSVLSWGVTVNTVLVGSLLAVNQATTGVDAASITQPINTSGSPTALRVTGGAHTTLAAGTEAQDVTLALARTVQFSTGAIAAQRAVRVTAPTYAFVGASTITDAATLSISGAPIAGANATFTRSAALWIETGSINMGAAPARAGDIRVPHNWTMQGRDSTDAANRVLVSWGVTANTVIFGNVNAQTRIEALTNVSFFPAAAGTERARITTTGIDFNNATAANFSILGAAEVMIGLNIAAAGVRNVAFFNDGSAAMNTMDGGIFYANSIAAPTGNPTAGGYFYVVAGGGTWRGSGGTVTTFGPA